jgi:hypothetical protein
LTSDWATVFPQLKSQANPSQYIASIMWFPFQIGGDIVTTIKVGWVDVPFESTVYKIDLDDYIVSGTLEFSITQHPQVSRGNYLKLSPFTTYSLFFPPWGRIQLDSDIVANANHITTDWVVDVRTGEGTLKVSAEVLSTTGVNDDLIISWCHSHVAIPYQIAQIMNRGFGIGNLITPAIGMLTPGGGFSAFGKAATAAGEIGNALAGKIPTATVIGSNGGVNALTGLPVLQHEFKIIADEDLSSKGRPLCQNATISNIPGFIVCDSDITIAATKEEQDIIKGYMEGGFFYE